MRHHKNASMTPAKAGVSLSRRSLLQRAGWTAAAVAFPSGVFAADSVSPVMAKLSAYMGEAAGRALPDEVVEKAKHHILDTFAAMISGSDLPPARAAFRYARDFNTDKTCTVVASKYHVDPAGSGVRQRHAGAFGRDRRLERILAIASGLRGRSRDAGGRRKIRHRRHALPARRDARL